MASKKLFYIRGMVLLIILFALIGFIYTSVIIGDENPKDTKQSP